MRRARHDLIATVPAGESVILIDNAEWGEPQSLDGRRLIPFPEENGHWAGRPADDPHAVIEARRAVAGGTRFFALWWTARWWLDAYPGLGRFLEQAGRRRVDGDHLVLFEMGEKRS